MKLAHRRFGGEEGTPLVLLHGGFGSWDMFGDNLNRLAEVRPVIGVDLQSHGRTPAPDRPMRFETMAGDVVELIDDLGLEKVALMGFSLGGGVALRTALDHPEKIERLVLVSTPFKRGGWHREMTSGMDAMGLHIAEPFKQTPMYAEYARVAPDVESWPTLVEQLTTLLKIDYDWSAGIPSLPMPVMIVAGDADGLPPSHAARFFELLGGGTRDADWDRSGMTMHRLAIIPGATHYDINVLPALAETIRPFLAEAD